MKRLFLLLSCFVLLTGCGSEILDTRELGKPDGVRMAESDGRTVKVVSFGKDEYVIPPHRTVDRTWTHYAVRVKPPGATHAKNSHLYLCEHGGIGKNDVNRDRCHRVME